jgi:undecaprenyl phosphate-alpha-L-ara4N flippase subunit ArnF
MIGYLYIAGTLFFTIYGQIIIKWRFNNLAFRLPESGFNNKLFSLLKILFDPYIFSGFVAAFIASLFWMAAMSKLEITKAYPFMSLAPVLVFIIGVAFLNEEFTWGKVLGLILIALGLIVTVKY